MSELDPSFQPQQENLSPETKYLDIEVIDKEDLLAILERGQVINVRPIEEDFEVMPHKDEVYVGDMAKHKDVTLELELSLPGKGSLLVVYKPLSGENKGGQVGKPIDLPGNSSLSCNKEVGNFLVDNALGWGLIVPTVIREDLPEGKGSLRPFIHGQTLDLASKEQKQSIYAGEQYQKLAVFDYLLTNIDGKPENVILSEKGKISAIDRSLTFFATGWARTWHMKGARLKTGYDSTADPPKLKEKPLPKNILSDVKKLHTHLIDEESELHRNLSTVLSKNEITALSNRAKTMVEQKIFL